MHTIELVIQECMHTSAAHWKFSYLVAFNRRTVHPIFVCSRIFTTFDFAVKYHHLIMDDRVVDLSWLDVSPKKRVRRDPRPAAAQRDRTGRPAVHEKHPQVVDEATKFVESNGFRAHRRRHNEIGSCGTSVPQLREHLLANVPGLKEDHPTFSKFCRLF